MRTDIVWHKNLNFAMESCPAHLLQYPHLYSSHYRNKFYWANLFENLLYSTSEHVNFTPSHCQINLQQPRVASLSDRVDKQTPSSMTLVFLPR